MLLPKKCGDLYVYFDEQNTPLYAFKVTSNNTIETFYNLTDGPISTIVLPQFPEKTGKLKSAGQSFDNTSNAVLKSMAVQYAHGESELKWGAFNFVANCTLVVPSDRPLRLGRASFMGGSKINIIAPENMGLKQIYEDPQGWASYDDPDEWFLLANKDFNINLSVTNGIYTTKDVDKTSFCEFTINQKYCIRDGEIVERQKTHEETPSM